MGRGRKIWSRVENTEEVILSKEQNEILNYLTKDFLTIKEIANLRNTSTKGVYKTISKLKKKGILKGVEQNSYIRGGRSKSIINNNDTYRLHAVSYIIKIIDNNSRYENIRKVRNKDELDNNTLCLYEDKIVIYLNKDFFGNDPKTCEEKSLDYISRFITIIENNYKIILKKGNQCNLYQFRGEIAKTNDPYAKKCNIEKEKIKIYDEKGKIRLLVDNSQNLNELEAVNNEKHIDDMDTINKKWLDLINTDLLLSNVENHLKVQQHINQVNNERHDKILTILEKMTQKLGN